MSRPSLSRRVVLARVAHGVGVAALGLPLWAYLLREQAHAAPFAIRPPGALSEPDFLSQCIKCGQCVVDCPYDTLRLARAGDPLPIGTPYFIPRDTPCYLCPDIPCVRACPTGALDPALTDISESDMGLAVLIDQENCLSYRGLRCEICHRDCPLQGTAITVVHHPRMLSRHALFVPIVHSEACTGCGICEKACPLPEATIKVLPRTLAQGHLGEHYRLGWTLDTPITQDFKPAQEAPKVEPGGLKSGLDYLNEDGL